MTVKEIWRQWLDDLMEKSYVSAGLTKAQYDKRFYTPQRLINGPQHGRSMRFDPQVTAWHPNVEGGHYIRASHTTFRWKKAD